MLSSFRNIYLCFLLLWTAGLQAQYISRSEPIPYNCPVICAGGQITLKINQIHNLPNGVEIQAWLSNAVGSFASGTSTLSFAQFSTNNGTTWQNGPYFFNGNINDLQVRVNLPAGAPPGTGYTIRIRASNGFVSNDLFQCSGGNSFTITAPTPTLPAVPQSTYGINQWIGHAYHWTPTTNAILNTPALVAQQSFFLSNNYRGHVLVNSLSFDNNFSNTGGMPGTQHDGTSMACGNNVSTNFSVRYMRKENFNPGFYHISIASDDGSRLSIDGGNTWILSSFLEQQYPNSFRSTQQAFPQGVCLAGETNLVFEYFQRPGLARVTIEFTPAANIISNPSNQTICAGQTATFNLGSPNPALTYQWQVSTNNGQTFANLSNGNPYSGVNTPVLVINPAQTELNGYLYQCVVSGSSCGSSIVAGPATLSVTPGPQITMQPEDVAFCNPGSVQFSADVVQGPGVSLQWQISTNGGATFNDILPNAVGYSGQQSAQLSIQNATQSMVGHQFQLVVSACGQSITSNPVSLVAGTSATIVLQPQSASVCEGSPVQFTIAVSDPSMSLQWEVNSGAGFVSLLPDMNISGTQTAQLSIGSTTMAMHGWQLRCRLVGACEGQDASQTVNLSIQPLPAISVQPSVGPICLNEPWQLGITAQNASQLQWLYSTNAGQDYQPITLGTGATSSQWQAGPAQSFMNGWWIVCQVSNACGSFASDPVQIQITDGPEINAAPGDLALCMGENGLLSLSAAGAQTVQWQWLDNGIWTNISQGNPAFGQINSLQLQIFSGFLQQGNFVFRCILNGCGLEVISPSATLIVKPQPEILSQPISQTSCPGESVQLALSALHATAYQWEINLGSGFLPINDGPGITGAQSPQLTLQTLPAGWDNKPIRCVIESDCNSLLYSQSVNIILTGLPTFGFQPQSQQICAGADISFNISTLQPVQSIQWQISPNGLQFENIQDDERFQGSQTTQLFLSNISQDWNGYFIRCVITACGVSEISQTAQIKVSANDPYFVPNAFTPNGDGVNPVFKIYTEGEVKLYGQIYSRWGDLLFSWSEKEQFWDGTWQGKELPDGVYIYRLRIKSDCYDDWKQGSLHLIRN